MTSRLALTVSETADALGVSRTVVYRMIRQGHLPAVTLPTMRDQRIPVAAIEQLLNPTPDVDVVIDLREVS